ncbi:polysaccharide pyruvyl transferase family protein [Metabacillus idriensis]|uniref:polysaccharide pyruvyl transferase family protein n=1 Tax=Metabacillus idriensis TaxID=324768 RepID=UPI001749227F|nr:polysaccharide pyruvyl transferase family protein [Metabacillus idriensis]
MNIFMYAHAGSPNRGCEAIVRSSATIIKEKLDGSKIYLASYRPETDQIISNLDGIYDGSNTEIKKFSIAWVVSSLKVKLFKDESYAFGKIHQKVIKQIKNKDICLSIGGDNYCYGEQPGWYEVNKRVKAQGKKLVLWGCSIGEEDMSSRKLEDLRLFDLILARESLTYNMLLKKGLNNVRLVADPAFTMEKEELELPDGWQEWNTIGLNFSPLVWKRNKQSQHAVKDLIEHILAETTMTIVLTPHVIDEGNNDHEILFNYFEEYKHTGRVIILPDNLNAIQYKGYIARMRFFIGARTHATIAAYSNCVPTMVLGYSVKSKGIAKDLFGDEKLVLNINEVSDSTKLINSFNEMLSNEIELISELKQAVPKIIKMSYKAVDYLNEISEK